jgi:dienelactone hydrolase
MIHRHFYASLIGLAAFLTALAVPTLAAPTSTAASDADAAYQAALPLYKDPNTKPPTVTVSSTGTAGTGSVIHFSYTGDGGEAVPALLFLPAGASKVHPVPCLIALHGLGGSKEDMTGVALGAMTQGYATFAIDEYGQGSRPHAALTGGADGLSVLSTGIQRTVVDVRRGLDDLDTRPDIDHHHIGLLGVSLGAIIGTIAAGVDTRIQAVALVSGGGDWAVILKALSDEGATIAGQTVKPIAGMDWSLVGAFLSADDPVTFAPHIAPRPVLMEHGRQDKVIVPAAAQALYDAASRPADSHVHIDWFPDAGHVPSAALIAPNIQRFLAKNL